MISYIDTPTLFMINLAYTFIPLLAISSFSQDNIKLTVINIYGIFVQAELFQSNQINISCMSIKTIICSSFHNVSHQRK